MESATGRLLHIVVTREHYSGKGRLIFLQHQVWVIYIYILIQLFILIFNYNIVV